MWKVADKMLKVVDKRSKVVDKKSVMIDKIPKVVDNPTDKDFIIQSWGENRALFCEVIWCCS